MKTRPYQSLKVKLDNPTIAPFFSLLQKGFFIEARAGSTIKEILCEQFQISPQYLENRIQTFFLDGKPVDEADKTTAVGGSTLALSTASRRTCRYGPSAWRSPVCSSKQYHPSPG
jgi:hypothetical protein